ncbi:MAG: efflux RND transporter periplasmic adaptor subunit [Ignavibacterium sp.]
MSKNNKKNNTKKKRLFIFGGLGFLIIAVVLIVILQGNQQEIITVQTEKIQRRNITQTVTAIGKIDPEFKVVITPEVTGEIVALPVKVGDIVKKGDLLIKIKADTYVAAKQRAEASLLSAEANLSMQKATLDKIESDYNRVKELYAKKLSSDAELETAKSNYLSAKAQVESAQAMVLQNKAAVKEADEQLYKTTISSPMDGTITELNVELGERVLGSGFTQGTNVMTVSNLSSMEAIVDIDENDIPLISLNDTARIKVDAFGDKIFKGIVTQIGNSAKTSGLGTQEQVVNFEVKIKLIDIDKNLRPGMSCDGTIETETKENILSIPIQSVTARTDVKPSNQPENSNGEKTNNKVQEIVFAVDNGKAKVVNVKTGISDDYFIEIINGLKEEQEIITGNYRAISRDLKDGSLIKIESKRKK